MKKLLTPFILIMGLVYYAQAQKISILDKNTLEPLDDAIILQTDSVKIEADHKGSFELKEVKTASFSIVHIGYQTLVVNKENLGNSDKILLEEVIFTTNEIVISATRWDQNARGIPSKISTITPKEVALYNPQTAADLLTVSGEVFVQKSQQGGGSPMIRGFATNRLLYTVDGIRMNSAIFRAGNIQNVISLDPLAIEHTEVLFGPSSVIYGSDAIGGVMSFQTLTPRFSKNNTTFISGKTVSRHSSANNELTNHFDINVGGKKWASVSSITYSKFGDLRMGKYGPDDYLNKFYVQRIDSLDRVVTNNDPLVQNPTGYSQLNMMQKLRYAPSKYWDFQYGFHYSETSEYARYDRLLETNASGLPVSAVWNYGPQIWTMNNLTFTHRKSNLLFDNVAIRLAQQHFEESRIDRKFKHHRLRTNLEKVDAYSANIDFEKIYQRHTFFYGFEYVQNKVKSEGSAVDIRNGKPILVADRYPQSIWSSYASYFNYQFQLSHKINIQAGVRYSGFNIESDFSRQLAFYDFDFNKSKINNASTTGSLGLVYSPDNSFKISVNGSTGFRAPNVDDIGKIFDFVTGEVVVPNTNLKAEYAYNAELNLSKIISNTVKFDVTGFYTYLDNAMVRRPFQINGKDSIDYDGTKSRVYAIQNAAFAKIYGFNAGVEIKLLSGFGLSSKINYQRGEEEMDNGLVTRSRHAAPTFGVTRITFNKEKLTLQMYAMYAAEVSNQNLNPEEQAKVFIYAKNSEGKSYSPSWYTLNFKVAYKFHENLSVNAGIENITNQRYRPYSSGLVAPGRNFTIALRSNF